MNQVTRMALKAISSSTPDIKKYYRQHRKVVSASQPYVKPLYQFLDRKVVMDDREIPVRIFNPRHREGLKVLIFLHGGGWVTGNIDSYSRICANMAKQTGRVVVSVDYRLAPEHPFPAGLEDCYYVVRKIIQENFLFRRKPEDIVLAGDSAGANLAAVVSLMARDKGEFLPKKQVLIYPAVYYDHSETSPFPSVRENGTDYILTAKRIRDYMDLYINTEENRRNPYVAPLIAEDLSRQPETLIITAEFDPLRDEGEAYGMRLKEFGNTVEIYRMKDALHGFLSLPKRSGSVTKFYEILLEFLEKN